MALDNRIIIINRVISSIANTVALAGLHKGEWFIAEDTKILYWKNRTTGVIEKITKGGDEEVAPVNSSVTSLSDIVGINKLPLGAWFVTEDTKTLYWKNRTNGNIEKIAKSGDERVVNSSAASLTDTAAITNLAPGEWVYVESEKALYRKHRTNGTLEKIAKGEEERIVYPTAATLTDTAAITKLAPGEWVYVESEKALYRKHRTLNSLEKIAKGADDRTVFAHATSLTDTANLSKLANGEWVYVESEKGIYWKNRTTGNIEKIAKGNEDRIVNATATTLSDSAAINKLAPGEWIYVESEKAIYWKNRSTNVIEKIAKGNEDRIVNATATTLNDTAAINKLAPGEWIYVESEKALYRKHRTNNTLEKIAKGDNERVVSASATTLTDTATLNKLALGEWVFVESERALYWKNRATGAIEPLVSTGSSSSKQVAFAANMTLDLKNTSYFYTNKVTGNCKFLVSNLPTGADVATSFILEITNGGPYTVQWWDSIKWDSGFPPRLATTGTTVLGFYGFRKNTSGTYQWRGILISNNIA